MHKVSIITTCLGIPRFKSGENRFRSQAEKLQRSLRDQRSDGARARVIVEWGMRYGNPSLKTAIERLTAQGCDRILFVPLYPQYSAATSGTACDKIFEILASMRNQPCLRVAAPYCEDGVYIEGDCALPNRALGADGFRARSDCRVLPWHAVGDPHQG
jgi:protoheme ferro-lyase